MAANSCGNWGGVQDFGDASDEGTKDEAAKGQGKGKLGHVHIYDPIQDEWIARVREDGEPCAHTASEPSFEVHW